MKKAIIPFLLIVVLALAGLSIYLFKAKYVVSIKPQPTGTVSTATNSPQSQFSDTFAKGLSFDYDPNVWNVRKFDINDPAVTADPGFTGSGVLATNKDTGGKLVFMYGLAFGVGGGWTPFKNSDVLAIGNGWARLITLSSGKTVYFYGAESQVVFFSSNKAGFDDATKFCDQLLANQDVYPIMSKEQCQGVKDGSIIGYVPQPQFSRSLKLQRLVPLSQVNVNWGNDSYIKQTNIDDGYLIIEIRYYGDSPNEADKIVQQINL